MDEVWSFEHRTFKFVFFPAALDKGGLYVVPAVHCKAVQAFIL